MNLQQIETFLEVARTGSFATASKRMSLPTSTVSARIKAMEERIGVTLLRRTTRKVALTSDGQRFFDTYSEAFEILSSLEIQSTEANELRGHIRLTAPIDFPASKLTDVLIRFTEEHPDITFDILMTDDVLDFVEDNIDIALRGRAPGADNLICRKVATETLGLFVSPRYFEGHKNQLVQGNFEGCVIFDPHQQAVSLVDMIRGTFRPTISSSNKEFCKEMAIQSRGIALLGHTVCENELRSGSLLALDWKHELPELPIYLVMPSKRLLPKRVRAFVDYLMNDQHRERKQ